MAAVTATAGDLESGEPRRPRRWLPFRASPKGAVPLRTGALSRTDPFELEDVSADRLRRALHAL